MSAALLCKDSPCSLNNSKDDVCVTPRCHTWLMRSSAWSPGSTPPIALPLGLQYWELGKSRLSKAETQQKTTTLNRTGGENATASCLSILFHLTRHAGGHLMIKHVSADNRTSPGGERESSPSGSHCSASGPSKPAWESVRVPLV